MELDDEQVKSLGLRPGGPKELSAAEMKMMGLDPEGPGNLLNKARVLGTAGVGAVTGAVDMPLNVAAGIDDLGMRGMNWLMRKAGIISKTREQQQADLKKVGIDRTEDYLPSVTKAAEHVGIPTDYRAEAKRLGEPLTTGLKSAATAVDFATGAGVLGAGKKLAALAGLGGAAGQATMGDEGAAALGFLAPVVGARALAPRAAKPPSMADTAQKTDDAWDWFRRTPATVDSATFAPFAQTVQQRVAAHSSQLTRPPVPLKEVGDDVAKVLKSGADVSMDDLWKLRRSINDKLQSRSLDPSDKRVLKGVRNDLDGYMSSLTSGPGTTGNIDRAVQYMKEAITTTKRLKDSQQLEKMIQSAELSGKTWFGGSAQLGNLNLHLRREFNKVIKSGEINKFAPDVQREIRKVASFGLPRSALELVGKFAPTSVIPGGIAGYAHFSGDEDAAWVAGIAMLSRLGANRMGLNQARRAADAARRPTPQPASPSPYPPMLPFGAYLAGQ